MPVDHSKVPSGQFHSSVTRVNADESTDEGNPVIMQTERLVFGVLTIRISRLLFLH